MKPEDLKGYKLRMFQAEAPIKAWAAFGAIVTSVLFNLGKLVLGLYIGKSAVGSSYGAAGAVLVLLLWVYYSGLIFYLGAEFTKAYADRVGSRKKQVQSKMRSKRAFSYENSSIA